MFKVYHGFRDCQVKFLNFLKIMLGLVIMARDSMTWVSNLWRQIMARASNRRAGRTRQKRSAWGDWRPYNAPNMAWAQVTPLASGVQIQVEIAGQTISAAAIPVVPFDPGSQLAAGTVTLDEEETFDVQVKGHIDVNLSDVALAANGGLVLIQSGLYRAEYVQGTGFNVGVIGTPQGVADVHWISRQHRRFNFGSVLSGFVAGPSRIVVPVNGNMRIGQGKALYFVLQANFPATAILNYMSFVEYRIRKNVD